MYSMKNTSPCPLRYFTQYIPGFFSSVSRRQLRAIPQPLAAPLPLLLSALYGWWDASYSKISLGWYLTAWLCSIRFPLPYRKKWNPIVLMSMCNLRSWSLWENIRNYVTVRKNNLIQHSFFKDLFQDVMQLALINIDGSRCCCYTNKNSKDVLTIMLPAVMTSTGVFPQILAPRIVIIQLHFLNFYWNKSF